MLSLYRPQYDYREVNHMSSSWRQKSENANVIIVGCGAFGAVAAAKLSNQNRNVAVIDRSRDRFSKLPSSFHGTTIEGDGSDMDLLEAAGAKNADLLIASTDSDNANAMIAQIGRQMFGIKKVVARMYDTSKQIAYSNMDIITICPTDSSAEAFEQLIMDEDHE